MMATAVQETVTLSYGRFRRGKQIKSIRGAWDRACQEAGFVGRIPHDFRRTAVRNLVRAGVPERVAMMITGHKTRDVFDRYNIVSAGDLKEAARRVDAMVPGQTVTSSVTIVSPERGEQQLTH
jgi:integrase